MHTHFRQCGLILALLLLAGPAAASDGSLDTGFGTGGKVVMPYPGLFMPVYINASPENGGAALQSTGKLIVAASSVAGNNASNLDFGAMRLNADASVDSNFGFQGFNTVAFDRSGSTLSDQVADMIVQPDDSILIAGYIAGDSTTGFDFGVAKMTADGQPDTSFGGSGKTIVQFNLNPTYNDDFALGIDIQTDHKILLAGFADDGPLTAFGYASVMAIARLSPSGPRDTAFNATGRVTIGFGGDVAEAVRARELSDGLHILVVGGANTAVGSTRMGFALARLNVADGSLDAAFGSGGKATYDFVANAGTSLATDFVELPDGRLMVCGAIEANLPSNYDFACMRFLANGAPDPSFSPIDIPFDLGGTLYDVPNHVKRDSQGRFVLTGIVAVGTGNGDCALARITPNGQLDPSFGVGGRATYDSRVTPSDTDRDNGCFGVVLQPDGKIMAVGYAAIDAATPSPHYDFEIVRIIGDTIFADGFGP